MEIFLCKIEQRHERFKKVNFFVFYFQTFLSSLFQHFWITRNKFALLSNLTESANVVVQEMSVGCVLPIFLHCFGYSFQNYLLKSKQHFLWEGQQLKDCKFWEVLLKSVLTSLFVPFASTSNRNGYLSCITFQMMVNHSLKQVNFLRASYLFLYTSMKLLFWTRNLILLTLSVEIRKPIEIAFDSYFFICFSQFT